MEDPLLPAPSWFSEKPCLRRKLISSQLKVNLFIKYSVSLKSSFSEFLRQIFIEQVGQNRNNKKVVLVSGV